MSIGWLIDKLVYVMSPLLYTLYWLFIASKGSLKWKHFFQWLAMPAVG
jgi:hypothetical protein